MFTLDQWVVVCPFLSFYVWASAGCSLYSWGQPQNQVNVVAYDLRTIHRVVAA